MMSEISSRKFLKLEMRQSRWLPSLIAVVGVFLYPIFYLLQLSSMGDRIYTSGNAITAQDYIQMRTSITYSVLGTGNVFTLIGIVVAAVLAAVAGFSYLTSREKTDFYHSLALGRHRLFHLAYAHGWLNAVIPYLCCILFSYLVIGGLMGAITVTNTGIVVRGICVLLLAFTAIYTFCVLAFCMSGRIFTGLLISAMLLGYGPICYYLIYILAKESFTTYFRWSGVWDRLGLYLSPLTAEFFFVTGFRPKQSTGMMGDVVSGSPLAAVFLILIYAVVAYVIAIRLFLTRKSEVAGEALISNLAERVIKVMVSIPGGALFGLLMGEIFNVGWSDQPAGNVFSIAFAVVGAFLIGGITEFIFTTDLKNIFRHWKSCALGMIGAAVILCVFAFDLVGYDSYFPEQNEVQSLAVITPDTSNAVGDFYLGSDANITSSLHRELREDFAPEYEMLKHRELREDDTETMTVDVLYKLQSGGEKFRSYQIPVTVWNDYQIKRTEDPAERTRIYKLDQLRTEDVDEIYVSSWNLLGEQEASLSTSKKDAEELFAAVKADAMKYSLAELLAQKPVGTLNCNTRYRDYADLPEDTMYEVGTLYIYPGYTETLEWLRKENIDLVKMNSGVAELPLTDVTTQTLHDLGVQSVEMYGYVNATGRDISFETSDMNDIIKVLENVEQVTDGSRGAENIYSLYLNTGMNSRSATVRVLDPQVFDEIMEKQAENN